MATTGIIDVGSNTIRLSIYRHEEDGSFRTLISKKIVAGLAGFVEGGNLSAKGKDTLFDSLRQLLMILDSLEVQDVHAFATASLRYVGNAMEIVRAVQGEFGLALEVVSGEEEARLGFIGARKNTGIENGMVVDIGGASCELTTVSDGLPTEMHSLHVGCLSIGVNVIKGVVADVEEARRMRGMIDEILESVRGPFEQQRELVCFVGGTARNVYKVAKELLPVKANEMTGADVEFVTEGLAALDPKVYAALRSVAPERYYTLLPGALIMSEIIKKTNAQHLLISKCGVREGYLIDKVIGKS